jgi:hypothetical protein
MHSQAQMSTKVRSTKVILNFSSAAAIDVQRMRVKHIPLWQHSMQQHKAMCMAAYPREHCEGAT